jgi:predicted nucleic acid-binding protein
MSSVYVTDTDSIICYFHDIFGVAQKLSNRACRLIESALLAYPSSIKLSIPSIVFMEIYDKWFIDEETAAKLRYEVFETIIRSPNIEVKPIEQEVLENLLKVGGNLASHDINDKLIVASAMMLECPLITTDPEIIRYVKTSGCIPSIIN